MTLSLTSFFSDLPTIEDPHKGNPLLHFNRQAFTQGQKDWLNARRTYNEHGIVLTLRPPCSYTNDEMNFWHQGIISEVADHNEIVRIFILCDRSSKS